MSFPSRVCGRHGGAEVVSCVDRLQVIRLRRCCDDVRAACYVLIAALPLVGVRERCRAGERAVRRWSGVEPTAVVPEIHGRRGVVRRDAYSPAAPFWATPKIEPITSAAKPSGNASSQRSSTSCLASHVVRPFLGFFWSLQVVPAVRGEDVSPVSASCLSRNAPKPRASALPPPARRLRHCSCTRVQGGRNLSTLLRPGARL